MFKIIWSNQAEFDYYDTIQFWAENNKSNTFSEKLISEVEKKEKHILQNPHSGIPTNFCKTYKVQVLNYFSIYYQIFGNEIEIVAFWDNRRNPDDLEI